MVKNEESALKWLLIVAVPVSVILGAAFLISYRLNAGPCSSLQDDWVASPNERWLAHAYTEACGGAVSVITSRIEIAPFLANPPSAGSIVFEAYTAGAPIELVWSGDADLDVKGVNRNRDARIKFGDVSIRFVP